MKLQQTREFYHFGVFRLDAAERRLWCADAPVSLTPKQFDLLFYFVENAGRVAKKSELLDAVWADAYIEESTLARNVSWLRNKLGECAGGEPLIETVPKLGYRFTAEVMRAENGNGNSLVVEEQIVQYFRGEESISIDDAFAERRAGEEKRRIGDENAFLSSSPFLLFSSSRILLAAVALAALVGISFVLYRNNEKSVRSPAESSADAALNRSAVVERPPVKIGSIVHLQNRSSDDGAYLDAWGDVMSNPDFRQINGTQVKFVSTHKNPNRDDGSGSWKIISADGKSDGEPLAVGDRIHLKNMYPHAGYLDTCGWTEHLRVFINFSEQTAAVSTTMPADRDNGSGTWTVRSAIEPDRSPVLEGDNIALESNLNMDDRGKVHIAGFLNVAGNVKDISSFNDYDGSRLVFTQNISNSQPIIDIWTITISKTVLE